MDKKNAAWKPLKDFQQLVVTSENPLVISIEKQTTNKDKVTIYWSEESSSSLFDEEETFKVSVSVKLAELLIQSGLVVKQSKDTSSETEFMELLAKKIAEKSATVETLE